MRAPVYDENAISVRVPPNRRKVCETSNFWKFFYISAVTLLILSLATAFSAVSYMRVYIKCNRTIIHAYTPENPPVACPVVTCLPCPTFMVDIVPFMKNLTGGAPIALTAARP